MYRTFDSSSLHGRSIPLRGGSGKPESSRQSQLLSDHSPSRRIRIGVAKEPTWRRSEGDAGSTSIILGLWDRQGSGVGHGWPILSDDKTQRTGSCILYLVSRYIIAGLIPVRSTLPDLLGYLNWSSFSYLETRSSVGLDREDQKPRSHDSSLHVRANRDDDWRSTRKRALGRIR